MSIIAWTLAIKKSIDLLLCFVLYKAFFSPNFDDLAGGQFVLQLHNLLMEQVNVLESALSVHGRLVSNDIRPLHAHLVERFTQMKKSLPQQIQLPNEFSTSMISPASNDGIFKTPTKTLLRKTSIVHSPLPPVPSSITSRDKSMNPNASQVSLILFLQRNSNL